MKDLHKLSKELEKFCIDNGIEKAKSGYLMGLFMKHKHTLNIAGVVKSWRYCECCEMDMPHYQILKCCECDN